MSAANSGRSSEHHVTAHNEGLCHVALGDLPAAAASFRACLALAPGYTDAQNMLARVEMEMSTRGVEGGR